VGECFFWYWPTRVVQDKGPLNCCVCVCVMCHDRIKSAAFTCPIAGLGQSVGDIVFGLSVRPAMCLCASMPGLRHSLTILPSTSSFHIIVAKWLACCTQVEKGPSSNRSRNAVR